MPARRRNKPWIEWRHHSQGKQAPDRHLAASSTASPSSRRNSQNPNAPSDALHASSDGHLEVCVSKELFISFLRNIQCPDPGPPKKNAAAAKQTDRQEPPHSSLQLYHRSPFQPYLSSTSSIITVPPSSAKQWTAGKSATITACLLSIIK